MSEPNNAIEPYEQAVQAFTGGLCKHVIEHLKQHKKVYRDLDAKQQGNVITGLNFAIEALARNAVDIIASDGRRTIAATLDQVVVKDGIKGVISLSKHDAFRHELMDAQGGRLLIVLADPDKFIGGEIPAPTPDQPALPGVTDANVDPDTGEVTEPPAGEPAEPLVASDTVIDQQTGEPVELTDPTPTPALAANDTVPADDDDAFGAAVENMLEGQGPAPDPKDELLNIPANLDKRKTVRRSVGRGAFA